MKKTPREWLLQKHHQAIPQLDQVRRRFTESLVLDAQSDNNSHQIVPQENPGFPIRGSIMLQWVGRWLRGFWTEVWWSNRGFWGSIAATWCVLFVCNLYVYNPTASPRRFAVNLSQPPTWTALLAEQRKLLAELDNLDTLSDHNPHPFAPVPRTEWRRRAPFRPNEVQGSPNSTEWS